MLLPVRKLEVHVGGKVISTLYWNVLYRSVSSLYLQHDVLAPPYFDQQRLPISIFSHHVDPLKYNERCAGEDNNVCSWVVLLVVPSIIATILYYGS